MDKIIEILKYENESYRVDFKKIEYKLGKDLKKNEILKDFSAFANHPANDDKFIIFGVKENENKTKEIFEIEKPTDEATYRQFVNDNIEPEVNFEYKSVSYDNKKICYFRFFENNDRPYLFKKDCKNPGDGKPEYKYGDGFIRVGTSTKKIGRKELNDIEINKQKHFDRKKDLEIYPILAAPSDEKISKYGVKYLDLKVINNSNKSIDLDIELKIPKSENYDILLDVDFLRELHNSEIKKKNKFSIYITPLDSYIPNRNVEFTEKENCFIVKRNAIAHKFALTIPQYSELSDIFFQSLILLKKSSNSINVEVIIKSDDFSNGALLKNISLET